MNVLLINSPPRILVAVISAVVVVDLASCLLPLPLGAARAADVVVVVVVADRA